MKIRSSFEAEIMKLKDDLLKLGRIVEEQIINAVESLKNRDFELSKKVKEIDTKVNSERFAIEEQVLISIATQQPMAHDLRLLASILEIAGELERIGDYAKGIATINIRMGNETLPQPLVKIPQMAVKAADMLHRSLTAFINEDVEAARKIPSEDDEVDHLYNLIYRELMGLIIQDATIIEKANWLLWTAHNLERMADRVTNICERTIFTATGELREIRSTEQ